MAEAQFAPDSFNYVNLPWCVQLGTRGGAGEHSRYLPDRRLDGSLDRPALQALLVQWLRQGKLEPSPDTSTDTADIEMAAHRYLARALEQLAQNALLEP